jgi:transcriptional regulator with GAF, ATPase, and Fis domain
LYDYFVLLVISGLFLDEIGEMELGLQSKLLKAVEELKIRRLGSETEIDVDVQIIAATNRDLSQQVAEGKFREDLYHRLSVLSVNIPPLRERLEDMKELVACFLLGNCNHCNGNSWSSANNTQRSITLRSSRVFPGQ